MGDFIKSIGAGVSGVMNIVGSNKRTGEYKSAVRTIDDKYKKGVGSLYEQYGMAQDEMRPYSDVGPEALAYLRSAIYGGEQSYADPEYNQLSEYDLSQLNTESAAVQRDAYLNSQGKMSAEQKSQLKQSLGVTKLSKAMINNYLQSKGGYVKQPGVNGKDARAKLATSLTPANIYDTSKTYYRGPNGEIIESGKVPQLSASFNPEESAIYKLQKERGLADLDRILRMKGRGDSTYGIRENGRYLEDLNANESERQLGRLKELLGVGNTASTNIASLQTGLGNNLGTMYQNWASKKAAAKQALGDVKFAKWGQMAEDNMNVANHAGNGVNSIMSGGMTNGGSSSDSGYSVGTAQRFNSGNGSGTSFIANGQGAWGQGGYYR